MRVVRRWATVPQCPCRPVCTHEPRLGGTCHPEIRPRADIPMMARGNTGAVRAGACHCRRPRDWRTILAVFRCLRRRDRSAGDRAAAEPSHQHGGAVTDGGAVALHAVRSGRTGQARVQCHLPDHQLGHSPGLPARPSGWLPPLSCSLSATRRPGWGDASLCLATLLTLAEDCRAPASSC
jgi:hypothetical protein